MRRRDVVGLAILALRQRKLRSALTTVGVAVGSLVLLSSVSIGLGVQQALVAQLRKQDQLRRILVWPGPGVTASIPPAELEVPGAMSEARRQRLRDAISRRWVAPARRAIGLTSEQVAALSRMEHVDAVLPALGWQGTATLWKRTEPVQVRTFAEDDAGMGRRLVAGRRLGPGEKGVLVSEFLVYRAGSKDEGAVEKALGQTLRVEVAQTQPALGSLLHLLNLGRPDLSDEEKRVLAGVMGRLPTALAKMDLPARDQAVLLRLLSQAERSASVIRELPVVGVFRDVARSELGPWDGPPRPFDVAVPPGVAEDLFRSTPGRAVAGLPQVTVRVDHEESLRGVQEQIKAMGLESFSFAELLDQVRLYSVLISVACSCVAAVALAVAALGITNTMLMSVLERTHEIGVMKATGAADADVLGLFVAEGGVIGVVGALLGLAAAWLTSIPGDRIAQRVVASQTPLVLEESIYAFPLWLVLGVPALVWLLTVLAALYPARRAARIEPIAALRQR